MPILKVKTEINLPKTVTKITGVTCDGCGKTENGDQNSRWDFHIPYDWIQIRVDAGEEYEEGYQRINQIFCEDCAIAKLEALMALGFKSHRHGSTNLLEDENCPGYNDMALCPTPEEYGSDY